jgi:hypothetical protein
MTTIEFGSLDDQPFERLDEPLVGQPPLPAPAKPQFRDELVGRADPWHGPDVEFVFDADSDPFQEFFEQEERIVERYCVRANDGFAGLPRVASCEGAALVRELAEFDAGRGMGGTPDGDRGGRPQPAAIPPAPAGTSTADIDDTDMVVIEEDLLVPADEKPAIAAVRLGDYRRLFARLRRGG